MIKNMLGRNEPITTQTYNLANFLKIMQCIKERMTPDDFEILETFMYEQKVTAAVMSEKYGVTEKHVYYVVEDKFKKLAKECHKKMI